MSDYMLQHASSPPTQLKSKEEWAKQLQQVRQRRRIIYSNFKRRLSRSLAASLALQH